MFPMMTPMDAISLSLRAGMIFGQTQTLWVSRMIEMQGLWSGFPGLAIKGISAPVADDEADARNAEPAVPSLVMVQAPVLAEAAPPPEGPAEAVPQPVMQVAAEAVLPDPIAVLPAEPAPQVIAAAPEAQAEPEPAAQPAAKRARKPAPRAE